ncbi:unnamed protein product, partial [marine sediment metagenome]
MLIIEFLIVEFSTIILTDDIGGWLNNCIGALISSFISSNASSTDATPNLSTPASIAALATFNAPWP